MKDLDPELNREEYTNTVPGADVQLVPESASDEPLVLAKPARGQVLWSNLRDILGTIVPALLVAILIQLFVAQATRVESYSMEPTLYEEQRLVIDKLSYLLRSPNRGEIVVLQPQDGDDIRLIKRVVGLPGETLTIRDGRVYINGEPLEERYLRTLTHGTYAPVSIPEGYIFVMGDNRDFSRDSRSFGPVAIDDVIGRAWLRYWPIDNAGFFATTQ